MNLDRKTREIILLALGVPCENDASFALQIALEAVHAEAAVLSSDQSLCTNAPQLLEYAHVCRLEALSRFVTEYMTASWRETAVEAKAAE